MKINPFKVIGAFFLLTALSAHSSELFQPQAIEGQTVNVREILHSKVIKLPVDISSASMRLSSSGYSVPTVKVLVPELAAVTLLNHRNDGEAAPCMATFETSNPEDVIRGSPRIEKNLFSITLVKHSYVETRQDDEQVCRSLLIETISSTIRGFDFAHSEVLQLPDRHIDDCQ